MRFLERHQQTAQALYVPLLPRRPNREILLFGVGGNLAIVSLYILTRTAGIPPFGPHAGKVEEAGFVDLCAMASELGIAAALGAVLLRGLVSEGRRPVLIVAAIAVVPVGRLAHLLLRRPPLSFSEGVRSAAIEPRVAPLLRRTPRGILRAS